MNETLRKMNTVPEEKDEQSSDNAKEPETFYHEMISQLKEKFKMVGKRSEKMQVLTVLASSWSTRRIQD